MVVIPQVQINDNQKVAVIQDGTDTIIFTLDDITQAPDNYGINARRGTGADDQKAVVVFPAIGAQCIVGSFPVCVFFIQQMERQILQL